MRRGRSSRRERDESREHLEDWLEKQLQQLPWLMRITAQASVLAFRGAGVVFHRVAYGTSLAATTWPGRIVAVVLLVPMLLDASWGGDAAGVPVLGRFGLFVLVGAVGAWQYERRRTWEDEVCEAIYDIIPGHSQRRPELVQFGTYFCGVHLGTWLRTWHFSCRLPAKVQRSQIPGLVEHLRQRLRAEEGASWAFDFDLRRSELSAKLVRDLPGDADEPLVREQLVSRDGAVGTEAERERRATQIPVGESREGPITWDCSNLYGCILIAGAPGGGKSVAARNIIAHCFAHSDFWKIRAIDMKRVEFAPLRRYMPEQVEAVALDLDAALEALENAQEETMRRMRMLEDGGVQNVHELNELRRARGESALQHLMIVVDEVAELTEEDGSRAGKEEDQKRAACKRFINSIVRLGRAAGVHMILSTQRPDAEFIPGSTKSNIQARLAMGNLSRTGSEMTLESPLAYELPGVSGRGIWYESGRLTECQVYYTSMEDLARIVPPKVER